MVTSIDRRGFLKEFFTLALPIAAGNLFTFGVPFFSHFMTAPLGEDICSGIFLSNQVFQLLVFVTTGIEATVAILGSQSVGAHDRDSLLSAVRRAALLALSISLSVALICVLFPTLPLSLFSKKDSVISGGAAYLRLIAPGFPLYSLGRVLISAAKCLGKPSLSLTAPLTSLSVNLALSLLLIRGPFELGGVGAGISSLAARVAELALILLVMLGKDRMLRGIRDRSGDARGKEFWRTLTPILLGQVAWAASNLLLTTLMSRVEGGAAASAFGVTNSLSNLAYAFMNGASGAAGIIISRIVGGGERDGLGVWRAATYAQRIFLAVGVLCSLLILSLSAPFISLYGLRGESADTARALTLTLALTFTATSYSASSLFGIIKSGGDVGFVLRVDALALLFLTLPLSLLTYRLGVSAAVLYTVLRLEHLLKCPIAYAKIGRRDWPRRLTNAP